MKRKNPLSGHHILPKSRGGQDNNNIVYLPPKFHEHWHFLFGNMTIEEVKEFIELIMRPNSAWTNKDIELAQRFIKVRCEDEE